MKRNERGAMAIEAVLLTPALVAAHHLDRRRLSVRRRERADEPRGVRRSARSLADDQPRGRSPGGQEGRRRLR